MQKGHGTVTNFWCHTTWHKESMYASNVWLHRMQIQLFPRSVHSLYDSLYHFADPSWSSYGQSTVLVNLRSFVHYLIAVVTFQWWAVDKPPNFHSSAYICKCHLWAKPVAMHFCDADTLHVALVYEMTALIFLPMLSWVTWVTSWETHCG